MPRARPGPQVRYVQIDVMPNELVAFALLALVFSVSALASGIVERTPLSFPMIFLGVGFLIGNRGLGIIAIGPHDRTLAIVATVSLAFVLFLDAVNLRFGEVAQDWAVPILSLGPGTLITVAGISVAAWLVLRTPLLPSLMLGAVLASIDPVVLRDVVRDERIPRSIRRTLRIEAGTNDIVVLPIVLALIAVATAGMRSASDWFQLAWRILLVGPAVGALVGYVAVWLIREARGITSISREYRALYGVGSILAAYTVGMWVGGSGFLAVFAAGAVIAATDYDLCDCFIEYSEITAEMTMLLAFILFGALLSSVIPPAVDPPVLLFAAVVLIAVRPLAIGLVLSRASISVRARIFIGWFGPRGLSSLLFALLLIDADQAASRQVLAVVGTVVVISVIAHGMTAAPLARAYRHAVMHQTLPEERTALAGGLFDTEPESVPRVTPEELAQRLAGPRPPVVLDVRSRSSYERDGGARIPNSIRVLPDEVTEWASRQSRDRPVVAYCT